ncbi:MAG: hypothetical protein D6703_02205 [Zetaproteobacteria bacterium]|nr:MAG: hypothetical protein D6703_02205 [Zetaproteobacteria bacterium]
MGLKRASFKGRAVPGTLKLGISGAVVCALLLFSPLLTEILGKLGWPMLLAYGEELVVLLGMGSLLLTAHGWVQWWKD